jgi:hypothetical protein
MGKNKTSKKGSNKGSSTETTPDNHTREKKDFSHVTLIRHPVLTLKVTGILIVNLLKQVFDFIIHHSILIGILLSICAAFLYAPGPHDPVFIFDNVLMNLIV